MSAEKKWTEGPWYQDKYGNLKSDNSSAPTRLVPFSGVCLTAGSEAEANTTLASAATELYEALKVARKVIYSGGDWPVGWSIRWLDAALAKARGEQ